MSTKPVQIEFSDIDTYTSKDPTIRVHDTIDAQLEELFLIRNPKYKFEKEYTDALKAFVESTLGDHTREQYGSWFYFEEDANIVHYLPEAAYLETKSARNKNLITAEEQEKFYQGKVAIAGLSVGSHIAQTIAMMSGCKEIKLADPDTIDLSNLNRIRTDATALGKNKAEIVAKFIYHLNPYAIVHLYTDGVTDENMDDFLSDIDILIEETDNLELKIKLRVAAKAKKIPVVMATDNGDGVIMDIERYDLHDDLMIFNGVAGDLTVDQFRAFPPQDLPKLAATIAGTEFTVPRMHQSLLEVGKTLYSWPQLGSAATMSGVVVAYTVRRMLLGEPVREGKFEVNLDAVIDPTYDSSEAKAERDNVRDDFLQKIGMQ